MTYKILSLDGGGAWAMLQVMALGAIYGDKTSGNEILRHFDLVAANSGGSITLGALIKGKTPSEILQEYFLNSENRRMIFHVIPFTDHPIYFFLRNTIGIAPKYSAADKLAALQHLLGESGSKTMVQLPGYIAGPHVMIASFDYDRRRAYVFRSNTASAVASGVDPVKATLAEAIHASSNAPINYFDAPAAVGGRRFWDGGVAGLNNPALIAVLEALGNGVDAKDIRVLSIGTGAVFLPLAGVDTTGSALTQPLTKSGLVNDIQELATSILDDPPDSATFQAHLVLGQPLPRDRSSPVSGTVVRMNLLIQPVKDGSGWKLPEGVSEPDFRALVNLNMDAVEQSEAELIHRFGTAWIAGNVPNQPVRINSQTLCCEIGHPRFGAARAAWLQLDPPNGGGPGV